MASATSQVNYANYPLKDIPQPHPHDVLCGRGGGTNNHIGNSHWRMLVAANKQLYITLPKRQKMLLSRSIVNAVRSQNPPGRFLQKDSKSNKWFDVGDQRAQEKTSQALREGAPDIRKKVASAKDADKEDADVDSTEGDTETPGASSDKKEKAAKETKEDVKPTKTPSAPVADGPVASSTQQPSKNAPQAMQKQPQAPAPQHQPPQAQQQQAQRQVPQQQGMMGQPFMGQVPGMGQMPQMVGAGFAQNMNGMQFQPQQGMGNQQQMMYFNGQSMVPMQLYPTMVLNENGVMVPAMSVMPPPGMQGGQQQMMQSQQAQNNQGQHRNQQQFSSSQQYDDLEPIPHRPNNNGQQQNNHNHAGQGKRTPDFDDLMSGASMPMGGLDPSGISFGSMVMTDAEMRKLQNTRASLQSQKQGDDEPLPVSLEGGVGFSFGDVSMMSVGTKKLEENGCSFGTMMSYQTNRSDAEMMKLEQIGTSFGSLSLDTTNRDTLFHQLELAAAGPEVPPMFDTEKKATGNLLDCSDTESETEEEKNQLKAQKSQQWEKMQSSLILQSQKSKGTLGSSELMPPPVQQPVDMKGSVLSVPTTNFDRDFSQLSAYDFGGNHDDDEEAAAAPPPQALQKQGSDEEEKLELYYLQQYEKQKG